MKIYAISKVLIARTVNHISLFTYLSTSRALVNKMLKIQVLHVLHLLNLLRTYFDIYSSGHGFP